MTKAYLHADLDAFFASVEFLDHPEWKGKPVIVGGLPEDRRSVVSTASYEARKYGVHSAMPTVTAVKLCPDGIFVRGRMERYLEMSEKVMKIFSRYSPDIQQISIDEAFIDLTGTEKLFGPPELTALKIKKEVFEETGLTVSIGLAPTKYLAKLASEVNKPDGFYKIDNGQEEAFMLNLPLEKVWGIGKKSLEALKSKGITTTRSIHQKSQSLLCALFGQSTGTFLYNVVRGEEMESFNHVPKSHSMSAENTYPFDLTGTFAIDTALLELCHTVIWRMYRENKRSSCISIKIRYEDFSTFSVQESTDRYISCLEDFYQRIKKLFYKKYDTNRGIRLLGVGVFNTEDADSPKQAELFDFGDEKKRKVEEAVFNAEKKLKGVKITKARLLSTLLFISVFNLPFKSYSLSREEKTITSDGAGSIVFDSKKLAPENGQENKSLFNFDLNDANVDFSAEGFWKTFFTSSTLISFGNGTTTAMSTQSPVLSSQVDLSLFFLLNKHWYFEAAFADQFETNTFAAGYKSDEILKEARLANRGIIFPDIYSIDILNKGIGGGKNLSPGLSLHFSDENWQADFALRYDALEAKSKTWYGKNTVTKHSISAESYATGIQFVLPSKEAVLAVDNVYVESGNGDFYDSKGRKYKKLDQSQYLLSGSTNSIYFSKDAKTGSENGILPAIAIEYSSSYNMLAEIELGNFGTVEAPGTGFLGETQALFSAPLSDYSIPLTTQINSAKVFFIQYPQSFSPYAVCFRYDAGIISSGEAGVIFEQTETVSSEYKAVLNNEDFNLINKDFFHNTHAYAEVYCDNELSILSPEYRFPFCKEYPEVYLTKNSHCPLSVTIRSYSAVNRFEIGTKAVPGTIRVIKNGIPDENFTYNSDDGTLHLSSSVTTADKITAVWYEDSSSQNSSSIAAAAGYKKSISPASSYDLSFASRWSYSIDDDYTSVYSPSPGYVIVASGYQYNGTELKIKNTAGISIETQDTKGKFVLSQMDEEKPQTQYLSKQSGSTISSKVLPVLNGRDIPSSSVTLSASREGSVLKPDSITDQEITGYAVPLSWYFSDDLLTKASTTDPLWAGINLIIPSSSANIASCSTFSIALKTENPLVTGYDLYLQLGVNGSSDVRFEDSSIIPTWLISSVTKKTDDDVIDYFDQTKSGWQIVKIKLTDKDRARLTENNDLRLIIAAHENIPQEGTILAGPYEAADTGFDVSAQNNSPFIAQSQKLSGNNYCQYFSFNNTKKETYTINRFYPEFDFENYKNLSLSLKFSSTEKLTDDDILKITLDRPEENGRYKTAFQLELDKNDLNTLTVSQHFNTVKINLKDKTTSLGKITKIDTDISPVRLKIELTSKNPSQLYLDSIIFTESSPDFIIQDSASLSYEKKGALLNAGNYSIIKNLSFNADGTASALLNNENKKNKVPFTGKTSAGIIFTGLNIKGFAGKNSSSQHILSSSGHSLQSESKILNTFTFTEEFNQNNEDETSDKLNEFKIDLSSIKIPLSIDAQTNATLDSWSQSQNSKLQSTFGYNLIKLHGQLELAQSVNSKETDSKKSGDDDYYSSWKKITNFAFDSGKEDAASRKIKAGGKIESSLNFAKLAPVVSLSAENNYKNTSSTTNAHNLSQSISIPFTVNSNSFYLLWEKSTTGVDKIDAGGSYNSDFSTLSKKLNAKKWFLQTLPFADLSGSHVKEKVLDERSMNELSMESTDYTSSYTAGWKRPFSGTGKDFFIPGSSTLTVQRDIKTSSSITDIYQIKSVMNFNAMNIFGSKSRWNLTDLFEQDEYITSFTAIIKFPNHSFSEYKCLISVYSQQTFFTGEKSSVKTGFELNIEDSNNLNGKATMIFRRPGNKSFLEDAVLYFYEKYKTSEKELMRTDSLNITLSRSSSTSSQNDTIIEHCYINYDHSLDIAINRFAELNASLGMFWNNTTSEAINLGATATIGATIKF